MSPMAPRNPNGPFVAIVVIATILYVLFVMPSDKGLAPKPNSVKVTGVELAPVRVAPLP